MSVELPCRLGPFTLLRHLASGGMGEVYLAHEPHDGAPRLCVVKTVRAEFASDRVAARRFVDEARTSALLAHRNIVAVYDVGEDGGTPYIAVEYVPGRDLMAVYVAARAAGGAVPEAIAIYLTAELLDALDYAHQAVDPRSGAPLHVVHRDVSPQNVLVSFDGAVKLIDFGIARCAVRDELTHVGQLVGKLRYISPEQARGEPVGPATDIWAACVTACELLTGQRFWGDRRPEAVAPLLAVGAPVDPPGFGGLDVEVQVAIGAGLDVDAARRPSAAELRDRLRQLLAGRGVAEPAAHTAALLEQLFAGERQRELHARATLLHEPSVVHAAAMPDRTAYQAEASEGGATADERPGTAQATVGMRPAQRHDTLALEPTPFSTSLPTPTARLAPRRREPRARRYWLAAAAALAAGVIGIAAWSAVPRTATVPAPLPPLVPPAGQLTMLPVEEPATAPAVASAPLTPATLAPDPQTVAAQPITNARPPHKAKQKKPEAKPRLFGDRVRALKECEPRPRCAASVLERADDVLGLSVDELRRLDEALERCLAKCR
ncbi:MAG: serine/threonine protein kinase [Deltaproteobacteria bacterium]|nr:serine/threonine protein kinase [Deltaproteobacteria bacterium]